MLRSRARLTEPADVAWMLASHARDAMEILGQRKLRALETIRTSFEEALGITFEGEQGDRFFRSSLVQTLFYDIFSGWVLWSRQNRAPDAFGVATPQMRGRCLIVASDDGIGLGKYRAAWGVNQNFKTSAFVWGG